MHAPHTPRAQALHQHLHSTVQTSTVQCSAAHHKRASMHTHSHMHARHSFPLPFWSRSPPCLLSSVCLPSQAMPFADNEDLTCPICEVTYSTANSVFVLSCAAEGCQGHLCFECVQKAVFPGNRSSDGSTCPHCRRVVNSYSYAFFASHKNVSVLQDKLSASEAEVKLLTKQLANAKAQAEESTSRLQKWSQWAVAIKSAILTMPSSATPPHARTFSSTQPDSEMARSRSPRQQHVQVARLEFAPSQAELDRLESTQMRVPEYDG